MTVRLLKPYAQRPVGAIATFDASTEAGMIEAKQASADLTGGFEYFLPRPGMKLQVPQIAVGSLTLRPAEQAPAVLPEGQVLNVSGIAGTVGKVHRLDPTGGNTPLQSWTIGAGALAPIGGYAGEQRFLLTCSAGIIDATVQNGAATALQPRSGLLAAQLAAAPRNRLLVAPMGAETQTYVNFATFTWLMILQVDVPYDAARPILFNAAANDIPGLVCCAAAGVNAADKTGNTLTWVASTFAGAATGTQKAGAADRPSVTAPDFIPVAAVPRTDGGPGYLLYLRVCVPTGGTLTSSLSINTDLVQLNSLGSGMMYSNRAGGDFVSTGQAAYNPGASRGDSPIWGVELIVRGQAVSILNAGDSITRAQASAEFKSQNMFQVAAKRLSMTKASIPISNANCGWSGQKSIQYFARLSDLLAVVRPTMAVYAPFSPNDDPGTGTLTQPMVDGMRWRVSQFVDVCRAAQIIPVLWTGLPALKGWNVASDNRRKAFNAELLSLYGKVAVVTDFDAVLSDGASPAAIIAGMSDGTHPYDNAMKLLADRFETDVLAPALKLLS
ncbi:hypothetical protein JAB4_023750 [Janthinobacterium sp. HH102]|uniref:SGNH/GDSL hydrolase family protein n=1 Tax=unclassified Janthinobacterium TaxID=2610881 RepID=UPI000873FB5C|nr:MULTISPECIES: hypothetical protein [unclassified Janthinobacterium]QOU72922.1 hypothetical protein JAB4_023750 [Janthinobacterium sp. HH102]